jgi:uncharacterized membrane protein
MTVARRFKGYFLHGLAVLLPSILTIWLFVWGYTFLHQNISKHLNRGLVYIISLAAYNNVEITDEELRAYVSEKKVELKGNPAQIEMYTRLPDIQRDGKINKLQNSLAKTWVDGYGSIVGFLIALVGVCVIGALLASYAGKTIWRMTEKFIMNTPVLKRVYPYIKQLTDFFLSQQDEQKHFSRVVAVEYPRKGIWSLGFVTGSGLEKVVDTIGGEFLTILIPTSPAPFTGFIITVVKDQVIDLNISMEEAIRFIASGGVVSPGYNHEAFGNTPKMQIENLNLKEECKN